jgi:hypothetical protein
MFNDDCGVIFKSANAYALHQPNADALKPRIGWRCLVIGIESAAWLDHI